MTQSIPDTQAERLADNYVHGCNAVRMFLAIQPERRREAVRVAHDVTLGRAEMYLTLRGDQGDVDRFELYGYICQERGRRAGIDEARGLCIHHGEDYTHPEAHHVLRVMARDLTHRRNGTTEVTA
jgi:hypothetical protein